MKKTLQNIKYLITIVTQIYLFILGLSWVFIHIYFRFIIERSSYYFQEVKHNFTLYHIILFILFTLFHLILIWLSILEIRKIHKKLTLLPKGVLFLSQKVSLIINNLYWKPLEYLHDKVAPHIPYSGQLFLYLVNQWVDKKRDSFYFLTMITIFDFTPKIIIASSFFIDIVIYGQIKYLIYTIGLIIIPISFSIFLKLLISCGIRNKPVVLDYFTKVTGEDPVYNNKGDIIGYGKYYYEVKEEYLNVINPQEEMLMLFSLENMRLYGLNIKDDLNHYQPYIILFTSILYLMASLVRLYLIFN